MKCPYCGEVMISGMIFGDGRAKVRWQAENKKISLLDRSLTEIGCIEAKYTLTQFKLLGDYCNKCSKIIIDAHPVK